MGEEEVRRRELQSAQQGALDRSYGLGSSPLIGRSRAQSRRVGWHLIQHKAKEVGVGESLGAGHKGERKSGGNVGCAGSQSSTAEETERTGNHLPIN